MEKNILSKEKFVKVINNIIRVNNFYDKIRDLFAEHNGEFCPILPDLENDLVEVLEIMFGQDEDDYGSDIGYFCYEIDYGRAWKPGCLTVNNEDIDISTPEKLYDWLIRSMNEDSNEEDS